MAVVAVIFLICGAVWVRRQTRFKEPLESSYAGVIDAGASKAAVIKLRNVSDRPVSWISAIKVYYRFQGKEWLIDGPTKGLKYPNYVMPGMQVDFPVLLETKDGGPITGAFEAGIFYHTIEKTLVGSLPKGPAIAKALSVAEGKVIRGVHWMRAVAP